MSSIETQVAETLIRITTKIPPTQIDSRLQTGTTSTMTLDVAALEQELRSGMKGEVSFSDGDRGMYASDAGNYRMVPIGVVLPRYAEDVFHTLAVCRRQGALIITRGGGTGIPGLRAPLHVAILPSRHPRGSFHSAGSRARASSASLRGVLGLVRQACAVAEHAFVESTREMSVGMREWEVAARVRGRLTSGTENPHRSDGFAFCMSGPNSARACAAYQQTGSLQIGAGEFILVHCNSYCRGFWTDITRTFCLERADSRMTAITDAVLEASRAAIGAVRPGVRASAVDRAARQVLHNRGFGPEFKHAIGHGVGFAAIDHNARPRIHPVSDDVLEPGWCLTLNLLFIVPATAECGNAIWSLSLETAWSY
jgi:hypothetical protein